MRRWALCGLILGVGGCCTSAPVALRPAEPSVGKPPIELPFTVPVIPDLGGGDTVPALPARPINGPEGRRFRRLTEIECLVLSAANSSLAAQIDEENRIVPVKSGARSTSSSLRQQLRYYTALEVRNRAAADGLERFFQLADAEARSDLIRKAIAVVDPLLATAVDAKAKGIRYPLDPADLGRQRSQQLTLLEQAELGSRLLDLDLKRRLGLPYHPSDERLWPEGDFAVDPASTNAEQAVAAALADRPELRGLRLLRDGLTLDTLPDVREALGAHSDSALGSHLVQLVRNLRGPDPAAIAELEVRRTQIAERLEDRERAIADEARAAVLMLNSQRVRVALARDRLRSWDESLADATRKREAKQPGAELFEPHVRLEWLKARAEVVAEVAAWHQARVRLRAAMGWLVWEAVSPGGGLPAKPGPKD